MIRLLRLQNFKCFENQSFHMGPLTVLDTFSLSRW
jgi:predicted ATPase